MNSAKNKNSYRVIKGKKLEKWICVDCHSAFYGYDYPLCPYCECCSSAEKTKVLYIFADCFSYHNGKPDQRAGYCTLVTNDRFDLSDKYNIEYAERKAFNGATNNFGELMGILAGLKYVLENEVITVYDEVKVISDSEYAILGARDRMDKWKAKGWKNTSGEVKNKELWMLMDEYKNEFKKENVKLTFEHQKGHVGKHVKKEDNPIVYLQEKCDTLATELEAAIEKSLKEGK